MTTELTADEIGVLVRIGHGLRKSSEPHMTQTMGTSRADDLRKAADRLEQEDADITQYRKIVNRLRASVRE